MPNDIIVVETPVRIVTQVGNTIDNHAGSHASNGSDPLSYALLGLINTGNLADGLINAAKLGNGVVGTNHIIDGAIGTSQIQAAAITGNLIANAAIVAEKIANAAIAANHIGAAVIAGSHIASGTITGANIAAATIAAGNIVNGTITGDKIGSATITGDKIANATITGGKIDSATITGANIAAATIQGSNIVNGTITGGKIATATITGGNIATGTISGANIGAATISAANIVAATITGDKIASGTIAGGNIGTGVITATHIADATITGGKIANGTITGTQIGSATIVAGNMASGSIGSSQLQNGAVVAGKIASLAISGAEIQNLTITAANIANLTITGGTGGKIALNTIARDNIVAATITATEIAASTITGAKIAADTITGGNIAAGTITASEMAANSITATQIAANAVTAAKIAANAVTADHISVVWGGGNNELPDSSFESGAFTWGAYSVGAGVTILTTTNAPFGGKLARASLAIGGTTGHIFTKYISIPEGTTHAAISAWLRKVTSTTASSGSYLRAHVRNSSAASLGTFYPTIATEGTTLAGGNFNVADNNVWTRYGGAFALPAGAYDMRIEVYLTHLPTVAMEVYADGLQLEWGQSVTGNRPLSTELLPGVIITDHLAANSVTAAKIAANTITAAQIAAGTITATQIAANTITAGQIAAGAITASELAADSVSATNIIAGTITSAELSATAIDGKTITGATIRTAASGARLVMDATGLDAFNSAGTKIMDIDGTNGIAFQVTNTWDALRSYRFLLGSTRVAEFEAQAGNTAGSEFTDASLSAGQYWGMTNHNASLSVTSEAWGTGKFSQLYLAALKDGTGPSIILIKNSAAGAANPHNVNVNADRIELWGDVVANAFDSWYIDSSGNDLPFARYVPLTTNLTSTLWDGDNKAVTAGTLIDIATVFGIPSAYPLKAIEVRGSARFATVSANNYIGFGPSASTAMNIICRSDNGIAANVNIDFNGTVNCDANGDIVYIVNGVQADSVFLLITGYYI